jgi:sugar O-acyltransferase (sialic acid O-acetyltransferase NeuD family)
MREPILLIGAGGHALSCIDVIEQQNKYHIFGIIGLTHEKGNQLFGYQVIGDDRDLIFLLKDCPYALITVGQIKSAIVRINLFFKLKELGYSLPIIISPHAYKSSHAILGEGTIVMHGAIINAGVRIGSNCIINSNALIEHGVSIGNNCHISTASTINGNVIVGAGTFIGSGSTIRESLIIDENCIIGMGQTILNNYKK